VPKGAQNRESLLTQAFFGARFPKPKEVSRSFMVEDMRSR
jgi:hypothetical protein